MNFKKCAELDSALAVAKCCRIKPKVVVHCITYNQGRFLSKCLDGFISQKTDFPFVAIVHDDASTDDTADVLKKYAEQYSEIIKPIYDTINRYREHSLDFIMRLIVNKYEPEYVAICEGDDYWTDPYKLQKQVDYMDAHPNCSLCHGDVLIYENAKKRFKGRKGIMFNYSNLYKEVVKKDLFWEIINDRYSFQTLTFLYRLSAYKNIQNNNKVFMMGDMPLLMDMSKQGNIKYFKDVFGVYNHNVGSATRNSDSRLKFDLSAAEMRIFYCYKYNYTIPLKVKKSFDRAYFRLFLKEGYVVSLYKPFNKTIVEIINNYNSYSNLRKIIITLWFVKLSGYVEILFSKLRILYFIISNNTYYKFFYMLNQLVYERCQI